MTVTRYDMRPDRDPPFHAYMHRTHDGEYVKYTDYVALKKKFVELYALLDELEERSSGYFRLPYCPYCEECAPKHTEECLLKHLLKKYAEVME